MQAKRKSANIAALILFLLLAPALFQAQDKDGSELKRDKGGIMVYMRDAPDSKIKELKFTTDLDASLNAIAAILTHVEGFDDWVYASIQSRTVKRVSESEVYYYTQIDFPWPLNNRDLVLHTNIWQDPKTLSIHSRTNSVHWMQPETHGVVRITKADLEWNFTPLKNGKVHLDYYLKSDPGGNIPAWIVNLAADQGPLQTMVKFKEMLQKEEYKNAKPAFVQEVK